MILKRRRFSASGFALPAIIGFLIMFKAGIIYFDKTNYYLPFDSAIWNQTNEKSVKMARGLIKNNQLIGLSQEQILNKLGKGNVSDSGSIVTYRLENNFFSLALFFENNRVTKAVLWFED